MKSLKARLTKTLQQPRQYVADINHDGSWPLAQSEARSAKREQSDMDQLSVQRPPEVVDGVPGPSLARPKLKKRESMQSALSGSDSGEQQYERVRVPIGMYGYREEWRPVKSKKQSTLGSQSKFSIFSSSKKAAARADAFQIDSGETESPLETVIGLADSSEAAMGSSHDSSEVDDMPITEAGDPYCDAERARGGWAARQNSPSAQSDGRAEHSATARDDWGEFDQQQMRDYLQISKHLEHKISISPVDSGIDIEEDDASTWHSAQSRVSPQPVSSSQAQHDDIKDKMAEVLALEAALQAEMEQRQQEWQDRLEAIALQKEQELERLRQAEIDRQQKIELQKQEEDRLAAEEAERNRPRECVCCGDEKPRVDFPARTTTLSCEHESHTCTECMHSWLAAEFETKGTDEIKCPECVCKFEYDDIFAHATPETFTAYEKMLTRNALSQLDDFAWCLSPTCSSGQLNVENESGSYMECVECHYKQCLEHKVAWHTEETCAQYEYRTSGAQARDEERATEAMLDEVSKKCPGPDCGWRIQKIDGCDHMKCKSCKFEFCWMCLASHKEIKKVGNTAHQTWCTAVPRRTYHAQAWDNQSNRPADF